MLYRNSLSKLCLTAALVTFGPALLAQNSVEIPIVPPDQVGTSVRAIHQDPEGVLRPAPFKLEEFDFRSQVSKPPIFDRSTANAVANSGKGNSSSTAPVLVGSEDPSEAPVRTGTGSAIGTGAGELPRIVSVRAMQDIVLPPTSIPVQVEPHGLPVVGAPLQKVEPVPDFDFSIQPFDQSTGRDPSVCSICGGSGCHVCQSGLGNGPAGYSRGLGFRPTRYYDCGFATGMQRYVEVDYLRWTYENDRFVAGNFGSLNGFGDTTGIRATLGRRWDCSSGYEVSFFGFDPWESGSIRQSPGGNLNSNFLNVGGFPASSITSFYNDTFVQQSEETQLYNLELNYTGWGWDVVKTQLGFRYIYEDEQYELSTLNLANQQGFYSLRTTNILFGPQIGWELFYDIGYRLSFSIVTKVGGYLNINRGTTQMLNAGNLILNASDRATAFTASGDLGIHFHYRIRPHVRARLNYDILGLWQMATVASNYNPAIGPFTGIAYNNSDDTFFHGASAGIEFYR